LLPSEDQTIQSLITKIEAGKSLGRIRERKPALKTSRTALLFKFKGDTWPGPEKNGRNEEEKLLGQEKLHQIGA